MFGFTINHDIGLGNGMWVMQLTLPGSIKDMYFVVDNTADAREMLSSSQVDAPEI